MYIQYILLGNDVNNLAGFKLRPLHRRRQGKRKTVTVLNQQELAASLGVTEAELKTTLDELGCPYHVDSAGDLWGPPPIQNRPTEF